MHDSFPERAKNTAEIHRKIGLDRTRFDDAYISYKYTCGADMLGGGDSGWCGDRELTTLMSNPKYHSLFVRAMNSFRRFQDAVLEDLRDPKCEISVEVHVRKYRKQIFPNGPYIDLNM
jgi:hypothetical protein